MRSERNGLRGSLTANPRKLSRRSAPATEAERLANKQDKALEQTPSVSATVRTGEAQAKIAAKAAATTAETAAETTATAATKTAETRTEAAAETTAKAAATTAKAVADETGEAVRKKASRKRRLPKFVSGNLSYAPIGDDRPSDEVALDFLFNAEGEGVKESGSDTFDTIIEETRKSGGFFSLSTFIFSIESFFEKIPTPLLFLAVSFVMIVATVNATTQWNRYEQRLAAIDKIATNAENNMLSYQLDEAINTLQELEKTEKGDLPPRARAILDQSLWLRSYAHAKKQQYAKAIADLSSVTKVFISYDDVTEKLEEYKKLLASHPEFADASNLAKSQATNGLGKNGKTLAGKPAKSKANRAAEPDRTASSSQQNWTASRGLIEGRSDRSKLAAKPQSEQATSASQQRRTNADGMGEKEGSSNEKRTSRLEAKRSQVTAGDVDKPHTSPLKADAKSPYRKKARGDAALLDSDMKRYSGLLVEYFSKAEASRASGGQLAEPPSYEEWTAGGKREF
jgi:hypothetical protein